MIQKIYMNIKQRMNKQERKHKGIATELNNVNTPSMIIIILWLDLHQ